MRGDEPRTDGSESRVAAAARQSRILNALGGLGDRLGREDGEVPLHLPDYWRRVVKESFVYRWFVTEPTSEMVTLDLRETYTLGPFAPLLETVPARLGVAVENSRAVTGAEELSVEARIAPMRVLGATVAVSSSGGLLAGVLFGWLSVLSTILLLCLVVFGVATTRLAAPADER
jgi:hypothetical protein